MSFATLKTAAGAVIPILRCELELPLVGIWHAEVELDTDNPADVAGAVTLNFESDAGATAYSGFIRRGGVFSGRGRAWIVGGKGGLSKLLPPKFYAGGVPLRLPFGDVLAEAGETLSASSDQAALSFLLQGWVRVQATGAQTLAALAALVALSWRVTAGGEVFLGPDSFAAYGGDFVTLEEDPARLWAEVAFDIPDLGPGRIFDGHKVGRVTHRVDAGRFRSRVWFE